MSGVAGLHLLQGLDLVGTPRRSAVARLDADGRLTALDLAATDDEIAALLADGGLAAVAVDAPLHVANDTGRRDAEAVLAWCDVAAFPSSRRRLAQVHGGLRGEDLAPRLARPGRRLLEALPDQVLRQIAWERDHPPDAPPLDLLEYRTAWIGVRAPVYRPKGTGRARPDGTLAAWRLLGEAVDLAGWTPGPPADDWAAIADAARVDAVLCAYAALRAVQGRAASLDVGRGRQVTLPADANLAARVAATLERLRAEGTVAI
jgi:predicted nuclease with RNAse H fold